MICLAMWLTIKINHIIALFKISITKLSLNFFKKCTQMRLFQKPMPQERWRYYTLWRLFITEIKPKLECMCCSSSAPSCLEVKEFADRTRASKPDAMPLARKLLWHETWNKLPTEQWNYQLQALYFFQSNGIVFFYEKAGSVQKMFSPLYSFMVLALLLCECAHLWSTWVHYFCNAIHFF